MNAGHPKAKRAIPGWMLFASVLLLCNAATIVTGSTTAFTFLPERFADGEWWRLFTHPFVHVSFYHLLLDGAAFILLYHSLSAERRIARPLYVIGAALGSLGASLLADPALGLVGFCGLSGIAHGLMAVSALQCLETGGTDARPVRSAGLIMLLMVTLKAGYEVLTGSVLFMSFHLGSVGQPLAACHAGGVIGALLIHGIFRLRFLALSGGNRHFLRYLSRWDQRKEMHHGSEGCPGAPCQRAHICR